MSRVLTRSVLAYSPDGEPVILVPGRSIPTWAESIEGPFWAPDADDAESDDADDADADKPAGNASIEAWREFALAHGKTEADLDGLSRNQIRHLFV